MDFNDKFQRLTGNGPFPWQEELFRRLRQGVSGIPSRCDIPTGLGKTAVIACWLLAREENPQLPRRLVYVVNRRTVVDQTTTEVERIRKNLPHIGKSEDDLAISTLRGQFADNREWSADPSKPAVICGTVDMIGSRLLFSGYGVGFKGRPLHAGFLGQDSLIVHDEAHLEPAFQDLLRAIQQEQRKGRFPDRFPMRVMDLSATSRDENADPEKVVRLTDKDRADRTVQDRIGATKRLHLHPQADAKPGGQLAKIAIDRFKNSGRAVLIFTRTIDDVKTITDALDKAKLPFEQLIGPMRGWEREELLDTAIFKRFLPTVPEDAAIGTVFLVCTSAGEVGVNISGDHLVCDLSTFDSMAQRFGRVNRFGVRDDTEIHVIHPNEFDNEAPNPQRQRTLALLRHLNGDASPAALSRLPDADRIAAFAATPTILPTSDILFDTWAMTSIRDKLPGRPPVEPYLHGIREYEPPETQVAWREEVGLIVGDLLAEYPPEDLLDEYPLKPHELLGDTSKRIWNELVKLADRFGHRPAWLVDQQGAVEVLNRLSDLTEMEAKRGIARIDRCTILLPHDVGGLTPQGLFSSAYPPEPRKSEPPPIINNDVADALHLKVKDELLLVRKRIKVPASESDPRPPRGMKPVMRVTLFDPVSEESEATERWLWFARVMQANPDARSRSSYDLTTHNADARSFAEQFVKNLSLDADTRAAVILAAACHDLGKDRPRWQRDIGNRLYPAQKWAKGTRWSRLERVAYRHEFGSMLDVQSTPDFLALSADARELALHLIAAHHGRSRPHFTADECLDETPCNPPPDVHAVDAIRRYARLQRQYGRWGLAYLESLVRAADYAASAKAEGGAA